MLSEEKRHFLSAERRMRRKSEFEMAFQAEKTGNGWFIAYARENGKDASRIGMVVSKKVMPKAVARNFAKRLIREAFRQAHLGGRVLDIVIRPRRPLSAENAKEGRNALNQLFLALAK